MAAMSVFRLQKRVAAVIAGLAFFLCQSIALAQACLTSVPGLQGAATQQPCHGAGEKSDSNTQSGVQGGCHYVFSAVPDVPVHAAMDTPPLTVRAAQVASVLVSLFDPPLLWVDPPPHSILHCCLRN
jgi:hypothetical protein